MQKLLKNLMKYPTVKREAFEETHFNKVVKDPYRWLEDSAATETKDFVKAQNAVTDAYLQTFSGRKVLQQKLTEANDFEKFGCPFKRGAFFYQFHNSGLQSQSVLYQLPQSLEFSEKKIFFDPNTLTKDGTAALSTYSFSKCGTLFAYGVSYSGSDWVTIRVKSVAETGAKYPEELKWVKFSSISWKGKEGFFYNKYPAPTATGDAGTETDSNVDASVFYHAVGTSQEHDVLIYKDAEHPAYMFGASVSDDSAYLTLTVSESCDPSNKFYVAALGKDVKDLQWIKVVDDFSRELSYITNDGPMFYFKTNFGAPKYKVVVADITKLDKGFTDIVAETVNVLTDALCINQDKLVLIHLQDCKNTLTIHKLADGSLIQKVPAAIGSIDSISGRKEDAEFFFKMSSFVDPGVVYRFPFQTMTLSVFRKTAINLKGFNSDDYVQKQVFYKSTGGVDVPMFIVHKKDYPMDKSAVTYLYGYGGFNISLTPMFSPTWAVFMHHFSGIIAVANIRGGGEYGDEWHKTGSVLNKQNCFDDFQNGAKYLDANGYSNKSSIVINGGSNGGLLVAACANQAPELFGCAIAEVGVLDMLRFHKFTIGHAWKSDYGDPDQQADFENLIKYSPVHTVSAVKGTYPSLMLMTGDHDDRVVPLHSFKFIAELQHTLADNANPLLIRIDTKSGHGAGKSTEKRIEEATDKLAFIALSCGLKL